MNPYVTLGLVLRKLDFADTAVDEGDGDILNSNDNLEAITKDTHIQIGVLQNTIYQFKKNLYASIVSEDKEHTSGDMGAMMSFHALFLQILGYWIGLLDNSPVPAPTFKNNSVQNEFESITATIKTLIKKNHDARTLVYSLFCTLSTDHTFYLGSSKKNDDDE